jgi:hypothetical protein
MEKIVSIYGIRTKVACDENCSKAWGKDKRPRIQLNNNDKDDYAWLTDWELDQAPVDPGTREAGQAKPIDKVGIPNAWCTGQCERCVHETRKFETRLPLPDFDQKVYSKPWHHESKYL